MKKFGFILIFIGLSFAVFLPWGQSNLFNDEIERFELEGLRENGSVEAVLNLRKTDNPVRMRFVAHYLVGAKLPPLKIPIFVKVSDKNGTLLATIVSFSTQGIGSEVEEPKQRGSQAVHLTVENDGPHAFTLTLAPNENDGGIKRPDIKNVEVIFVRNAGAINEQYTTLGFVLAVLGFYLIIRGRRNRKKNSSPKWGRGDD